MGISGASLLANTDAGDWKQAHEALSRLSRQRAALDAEEGRWLLRALRSAAHNHLGHASFVQYIERLFGYRPRTTREKLRVAEALETLPRLGHALDSGAIGWCAARELTRVAVADTEQAWLEAARGKTQRELETLVANKALGDRPDTPATEVPRTRVLRFEVAADTFATFQEATEQLRRRAGSSLDDDALLLAMARHVLGGPGDEGRSSYQISLDVCKVCSAGAERAAGELVPVDAAVVAMAACDAQQLGELLPRVVPLRAANQNAGIDADSRADPEGQLPTDAASARGGIDTEPDESSNQAHVGPHGKSEAQSAQALRDRRQRGAASGPSRAPPERAAGLDAGSLPRARQSIPPALRRAVLARDRHHCRVPGCVHATFVDVHHVTPRAEGGRNTAENLLTLCAGHHRAAHRGELLIERKPDGTIGFRHADGSAYGDSVTPTLVDAYAKVYSALRQLGFRERDVRVVLSELRGDAELCDASVQRLLREALCRIGR